MNWNGVEWIDYSNKIQYTKPTLAALSRLKVDSAGFCVSGTGDFGTCSTGSSAVGNCVVVGSGFN